MDPAPWRGRPEVPGEEMQRPERWGGVLQRGEEGHEPGMLVVLEAAKGT